MPSTSHNFSIYFKLIPNLPPARHKAAERRIQEFLTKYATERISSYGYTLYNEDPTHIITLWNAIKRATDGEAHMVLLRHENLGMTALPSDLSPQILATPRVSLQNTQQLIQQLLEQIP